MINKNWVGHFFELGLLGNAAALGPFGDSPREGPESSHTSCLAFEFGMRFCGTRCKCRVFQIF